MIPDAAFTNYLHLIFIFIIYIACLLSVMFGEYDSLVTYVNKFSESAENYKQFLDSMLYPVEMITLKEF